jgi:uncharacterized membrane protein (DUF106 family)
MAAQITAWINTAVNAAGRFVFWPITQMPPWLSIAVVSCLTGLVLLIIYKHTSNQKAIETIRDDIKADLLTLKLFKDNMPATFKAQGRLMLGAGKLLAHSLVPMLVMMVPVVLLLAQLGLYYQHRPLRPGECAVVTVKLNGWAGQSMPDIQLAAPPNVETTVGPVRILTKREVCWEIRTDQDGKEPLVFTMDGRQYEKQLIVDEGLARVSRLRPGLNFFDVLIHPAEKPLPAESPVQSIDVTYPQRDSWNSGTDNWIIYFFVASMVFAFLLKPVFKVKI